MTRLDDINASLGLLMTQTQENIKTLAIILLIPWTIFIINNLLGKRLFFLGLFPRQWYGLPGILFSPLLHANFNHLFFNSIPLFILSDFLLINGLAYFIFITFFITLLSGLLLWCFGKPGVHIGASGLITGYWALLVSDIYRQGTIMALILGAISIYYFSGIFLGIFPGKKGISWEGHFFGLLAGLMISYLLT